MRGRVHHQFTVVGRWCFPVDMLRYDNCQPATDGDRVLIEKMSAAGCPDDIDIRQHYEINLVTENHRFFEPTEERWASFGWHVSKLNGSPTRYAKIPVHNMAELPKEQPIPDAFFRVLSAEEEESFRQWARDNFKPTRPDGYAVFHPVVRAEWEKIEKERGDG